MLFTGIKHERLLILFISCLDDSELQFLGAPWNEYAHEASQLGIDILRLAHSITGWVNAQFYLDYQLQRDLLLLIQQC
jgi:hypothetical protein